MKRNSRLSLLRLAVLLAIAVTFSGCGEQRESARESDHASVAADDFERGPHNGRLLRDGDFALEITIFETGVPPEFRVYPFRNDQPIDPATVDLAIELGCLGDRVDRFAFFPQGDYLRGDGTVLEPHSFDFTVSARSSGRRAQWHYESYEGRTRIEPAVARAMGIVVEEAASGTIRETIPVQGSLRPMP